MGCPRTYSSSGAPNGPWNSSSGAPNGPWNARASRAKTVPLNKLRISITSPVTVRAPFCLPDGTTTWQALSASPYGKSRYVDKAIGFFRSTVLLCWHQKRCKLLRLNDFLRARGAPDDKQLMLVSAQIVEIRRGWLPGHRPRYSLNPVP